LLHDVRLAPAELHAQGTCHSLTAARTPFEFTGSVEFQFLRTVDKDKKNEKLYLFIYLNAQQAYFHDKVNRQNARKTIAYN
jgi:hypothetical protein